jgi:hypothetical protein
MSPEQYEAILRRVLEAVVGGQVSLAVAGAAGLTLTGAITALFAWCVRLATEFAAKVETLGRAQQEREDERDKAADDRCAAQVATLQTRIDRLETSRDAAVAQHAAVLRDAHALTLKALAQATEALDETGRTLELVLDRLSRSI